MLGGANLEIYAHPFDCPHIDGSWCDRIVVRPAPAGIPLLGPCWIWLGWNNAKPGGAYGKVEIKGRAQYLHRVMWERYHNLSLHPGDCIDHKCRVRLCFSPHHIECCDYEENNRRRDEYAARFNNEINPELSQEDIDALARGW